MCTGLEVPLILSAIGTGAGAYANNQALKKQDNIAAQGIRRQSQLSQEADSRVRQQIADTANSKPAADQASEEAQLMAAIRSQRAPQPEVLGAGSGASTRFAEDVANSRRTGNANVAQLITNLSKIDAPAIQRQREAVGTNRAATDLGLLGLRSQSEDFLTKLRASQVRPNPWVTALGSLAHGVGSGMAANAKPTGLAPGWYKGKTYADLHPGVI